MWLAVVSQPCDRSALVPLPGKLDESLREFWVNNPWQIIAHGHNLSAYERNRVFLNLQGKDFLDISHLTGADSEGDGRAVVAADFRNVGMLRQQPLTVEPLPGAFAIEIRGENLIQSFVLRSIVHR